MGTCHNSTVVAAPLATVWAAVRDFYELDWAAGVVDKVEKLNDLAGTQLGARRKLNDVFEETLVGLSDMNHTIQYTIEAGPGPLAGGSITTYVGEVTLAPVTASDATLVTWTSRYVTADDGATAELCNPIYQALLSKLSAHFA